MPSLLIAQATPAAKPQAAQTDLLSHSPPSAATATSTTAATTIPSARPAETTRSRDSLLGIDFNSPISAPRPLSAPLASAPAVTQPASSGMSLLTGQNDAKSPASRPDLKSCIMSLYSSSSSSSSITQSRAAPVMSSTQVSLQQQQQSQRPQSGGSAFDMLSAFGDFNISSTGPTTQASRTVSTAQVSRNGTMSPQLATTTSLTSPASSSVTAAPQQATYAQDDDFGAFESHQPTMAQHAAATSPPPAPVVPSATISVRSSSFIDSDDVFVDANPWR